MPEWRTLPTAEQPLRVAEFDRLFRESVLPVTWRHVRTTRTPVADALRPVS